MSQEVHIVIQRSYGDDFSFIVVNVFAELEKAEQCAERNNMYYCQIFSKVIET